MANGKCYVPLFWYGRRAHFFLSLFRFYTPVARSSTQTIVSMKFIHFLDCPLARFLHLTDTETCHCNSERETIRTRTYQPKIYMGHDKKKQKLSNIFVGVQNCIFCCSALYDVYRVFQLINSRQSLNDPDQSESFVN